MYYKNDIRISVHQRLKLTPKYFFAISLIQNLTFKNILKIVFYNIVWKLINIENSLGFVAFVWARISVWSAGIVRWKRNAFAIVSCSIGFRGRNSKRRLRNVFFVHHVANPNPRKTLLVRSMLTQNGIATTRLVFLWLGRLGGLRAHGSKPIQDFLKARRDLG